MIKGHLFSKGNILRPPTVRAKWSQMIFCHSTKLAQWVCVWTTFVSIPAVVWGESSNLIERGGDLRNGVEINLTEICQRGPLTKTKKAKLISFQITMYTNCSKRTKRAIFISIQINEAFS